MLGKAANDLIAE